MKPTIPLKLSAFAFTVLWSGWMLWVAEAMSPPSLAITRDLRLRCGLSLVSRHALVLPADAPAAGRRSQRSMSFADRALAERFTPLRARSIIDRFGYGNAARN